MTARIHNKSFRRQQFFDLLKAEETFLAARNQAGRGRIQHERGAFDLRRQRGDPRVTRGMSGPGERGTRRRRAEASYGDARNHQFVGGPERGWPGRMVEFGERMLGLVKTPDKKEAPDREIPRMGGVHPVSMLFERRPRGIERLRGPAQITRDERDLGFGDNAPRAGHCLFRTESARRTPQENLRAIEIAELGHRDTAKRQRRRVVTQGDPVQGAEGITCGKRTRRGGDQRIHRNPVTLVTPSPAPSGPKSNAPTPIGTPDEGEKAMTTHKTGTRKEWLAARLALLEEEKELTRWSDTVAQKRQALPWVPIDKEYRFETDEGQTSLAGLFQGRSQLLVYHFMFGPDYKAGCPSCSSIADGFNGIAVHLANHDVMLWAVSRAALAKLQAYKRRMGWTFPWASSFAGDFNPDFSVSFSESQQREGIDYNYQREPALALGGERPEIPTRATPEGPAAFAAMSGTDVATYARERPGVSAFVLEDGIVYHTYSAYSRGVDGLWGMYQWLDRAPKGRNDAGIWWRRHDEYDKR